jgi:hypothetical protein
MHWVIVMAGLDPAIHGQRDGRWAQGVDARVTPGHDESILGGVVTR